MDKYRDASEKYNKARQKFLSESHQYLIEKDTIKLMHQEIIVRQQELIKLSCSDPRTISKYFQTFQPLHCNPAHFKNIHQFGGPKLAFNTGKIYIGSILQGKRHGKGLIASSKGKIYEGQMANNMRSGMGVQIYQNTNFYVGNFQENKRSGNGKMIWVTQNQETKQPTYQYYNGFWKDGEPHGYGLHCADNIFYVGQFKNGVKHGKGIQTNGSEIYEGFFAFGKREGKGFLYVEKSECYQGDFQKSIKHGYGKWLSLNSFEEYEGFFQNGKKQGIGVIQKENQFYYKGMFTEDRPSGRGEYFPPHSKIVSTTKETKNEKYQSQVKEKGQLKSAQFVRATTLKDEKNKFFGSVATQDPNNIKSSMLKRKKLYSAKSLNNPMSSVNPQVHQQKKCTYRRCSCNNWQKKSSSKVAVDEGRIKRIFSSRKVLLKQLG